MLVTMVIANWNNLHSNDLTDVITGCLSKGLISGDLGELLSLFRAAKLKLIGFVKRIPLLSSTIELRIAFLDNRNTLSKTLG